MAKVNEDFLALSSGYLFPEIARRTRAKNIAKGVKYNEEGLIEDELRKMEQR